MLLDDSPLTACPPTSTHLSHLPRSAHSATSRRDDDRARAHAFRAGLVEHLPSLRLRALKLCRNSTEAADLVQDTVERALRFEASYRQGTNLKAWLQQVLFSVFISKQRRRRREQKAMGLLCHDPNAWTRADGAPAMTQLSTRLNAALEELPPKFQSVVKLVDLGELSYREAAEQLQVPVGTVMSRLFRGRRQLAGAIEETPSQRAA